MRSICLTLRCTITTLLHTSVRYIILSFYVLRGVCAHDPPSCPWLYCLFCVCSWTSLNVCQQHYRNHEAFRSAVVLSSCLLVLRSLMCLVSVQNPDNFVTVSMLIRCSGATWWIDTWTTLCQFFRWRRSLLAKATSYISVDVLCFSFDATAQQRLDTFPPSLHQKRLCSVIR